jgi:hypothetical protein
MAESTQTQAPARHPDATGASPVDTATMRATVAGVLPPEVTPVDLATLETLTGLLVGHMQLLIPEMERAAAELPADDVPRYVALACVREARGKLAARPGLSPYDDVAHVRRLGRSLLALCVRSPVCACAWPATIPADRARRRACSTRAASPEARLSPAGFTSAAPTPSGCADR